MAIALCPPEQCIILEASWETYERLLAEHQDSAGPRLTYSAEHERPNRNLARIAEELETEIEALGSMTFKREDLKKGFEPDSSFYIQNAALGQDPFTPPA